MPKIKVKKGSIHLDMTAMCDVAFLLLTFFVLTAKAKPIEPTEVVTPTSSQDFAVRDLDVITIMVDKKGRTFMGMDNNKNSRELWLDNLMGQFNFDLSTKQKTDFINGNYISVPIEQLPGFLAADAAARKDMITETEGIPIDTANTDKNQLKDYLRNARIANSEASIVIKADAQAPYSSIKMVMKTLQNQNVDKFSLLTTLAND